MAQLYNRLGSVGFPRKYLREIVLPDWWDDEIAYNPAGYAEGLMILSRNLGLDLASMQSEAVPVGLRNWGRSSPQRAGNAGRSAQHFRGASECLHSAWATSGMSRQYSHLVVVT